MTLPPPTLSQAEVSHGPRRTRVSSGEAEPRPVVAIIPARGGSKGIPRKNLADLGGMPLVAHTILAARRSGAIDRLFVSTDDPEIAEVAVSFGAEVPVLRPPQLATDTADPMLAVLHMLHHLRAEEGLRARMVAVFQPTTPFRRPGDIARAVSAVRAGAWQVSSVVRLDRPLHPHYLIRRRMGGRIRLKRLNFMASPRYVFYPTGYLLVNRYHLVADPMKHPPTEIFRRVNLFAKWCRVLGFTERPPHQIEVDWIRGLDIDIPEDLELARRLWDERHVDA